jgi:hypothetical protein
MWMLGPEGGFRGQIGEDGKETGGGDSFGVWMVSMPRKIVEQKWLGKAFFELTEVYIKCETTRMWRKRQI